MIESNQENETRETMKGDNELNYCVVEFTNPLSEETYHHVYGHENKIEEWLKTNTNSFCKSHIIDWYETFEEAKKEATYFSNEYGEGWSNLIEVL
jgi:hypothetical protein